MGRLRRMSVWRTFFDKGVRHANAMHKKIKNGEVALQTVDYTEGGVAINVPHEMVAEWEAMPAEVRAEFLADVDAQVGRGNRPGLHDDTIQE